MSGRVSLNTFAIWKWNTNNYIYTAGLSINCILTRYDMKCMISKVCLYSAMDLPVEQSQPMQTADTKVGIGSMWGAV